MTWMTRLYETYEAYGELEEPHARLWPVSHFVKNAHIEITIDNFGFIQKDRCKVLPSIDAPTLIPATEASSGRTGSLIAPHPLSDELGYCAVDLPGANPEKLSAFFYQLSSWVEFDKNQKKLIAIQTYLKMSSLYKDICSLFSVPLRIEKKDGFTEKIKPEKIFVRWRVEEPGNPVTATWEDHDLIDSWIKFDSNQGTARGLCYITGNVGRIARNNPKFIRRPGDGAKLISSNDTTGFTFRGRFTDSKSTIESQGLQSVGVSYDVSQKAHSALRALIANQGYKVGGAKDHPGSVIVSWAVSGNKIPNPMDNSFDLLGGEIIELTDLSAFQQPGDQVDNSANLGQQFATSLNTKMAGYRAKFPPSDNIIIMGLDSATPGRMAITYYQELVPQEFIERVSKWHRDFAWFQRYTTEKIDADGRKRNQTIWPVSSPAPRTICEAIYGHTVTDSLRKNTIERILPCIIEGATLPRDYVEKSFHIAVNRHGYKSDQNWLWEQHLGIACSLFKGFSERNPRNQKEYIMALEESNCSRDYLFGRLLAIAERIEEVALRVSDESRSTTAARLMQRFADRPASTWRNIELALQPYIQRLKVNRPGFLVNQQRLLDEVMSKFQMKDFTKDKPLSGEFLLAFHTQRLELNRKSDPNHETQPIERSEGI